METYKDIQNLSDDELETRVEEARDKLRIVRFDCATKEMKDTRLKRNTRKYLARLLTVWNTKH